MEQKLSSPMKSLRFTSFLFLLFFSFSVFSEDDNSESLSLFGGNEEVVYFFSYHCAQCFDAHSYLSGWAKSSDKKIHRVPVFSPGDDWEFGARLYFILSFAKNKFSLTDFEREKAAYQIVLNMDEYPQTASGYSDLLREYGLDFDSTEFFIWWRQSELMLASAEEILDSMDRTNLTPPSLRVVTDEKVYWVDYSPYSLEPGFEILKRLNSIL